VELNPVRAKLVAEPGDYRWSSAAAHLAGRDDGLVKVAPLLGLVPDWQGFLAGGIEEKEIKRLRRHERTGRPVGSEEFLSRLEATLGRPLRPRKPVASPSGGGR